MLPQGETSRIEKRCYGSVVESVIYRVGGADGGVAAVRCGSSRGDPLRSLAMVVTIELGLFSPMCGLHSSGWRLPNMLSLSIDLNYD